MWHTYGQYIGNFISCLNFLIHPWICELESFCDCQKFRFSIKWGWRHMGTWNDWFLGNLPGWLITRQFAIFRAAAIRSRPKSPQAPTVDTWLVGKLNWTLQSWRETSSSAVCWQALWRILTRDLRQLDPKSSPSLTKPLITTQTCLCDHSWPFLLPNNCQRFGNHEYWVE